MPVEEMGTDMRWIRCVRRKRLSPVLTISPGDSDGACAHARLRAEALVPPTAEDRDSLVIAVSEDLQAEADREATVEARLVKVEAQTRGLAEAVIAIAHPQGTVALVQAVRDEMSEVQPVAQDPGID